jgi:hypothetical protein
MAAVWPLNDEVALHETRRFEQTALCERLISEMKRSDTQIDLFFRLFVGFFLEDQCPLPIGPPFYFC